GRAVTAAARPLVLVTGAAGRVGTALRPHLRERFDLRLHDRVPVPDPQPGESVVTGDLADLEGVSAAARGADAVLHLATAHGLGLYGTGAFPGDDAALAPDGVYGLGEAFGELACRTYARRHGIRTLIVRIGNADPHVTDRRVLRLWTSARDLAQLVTIGLTHPDVVCDVVYGVSECPDPLFANERARRLCYRPLDRAVDNLAPGFASPDDLPEGPRGGFVGGAYAAYDLAPRWEDR